MRIHLGTLATVVAAVVCILPVGAVKRQTDDSFDDGTISSSNYTAQFGRSEDRNNVVTRCKQFVPTVENGYVSSSNKFTLGATRTVSCDPTYILNGANLIICTAKGWTRPGTCRSVTNRFFVIKDMMSWYDAVVRCASAGARLAMPKTAVDNAVIIHIMRRQKCWLAWIGLSRMASGSERWQWIDGTPFDDSGYKSWLPGEPNNALERCAQFHLIDMQDRDMRTGPPQLYGWNDFHCAHNRTLAVLGMKEHVLDIGAICERTNDDGSRVASIFEAATVMEAEISRSASFVNNHHDHHHGINEGFGSEAQNDDNPKSSSYTVDSRMLKRKSVL